MKIKHTSNYVLLIALVLVSLNCTKKQEEQTGTKNKDTIKTIQKTSFDIKSISKETLPQNIKDYIALNYKDYQISEAAYDPLCSGGDAIDVSVNKNGKSVLSLIFKPDGTYVQKEEDVPFSNAPQKVKEVIKSKFSTYKASEQIEKLTLADNTIQYLVDIEKDTISKEVILTSDGQIVCEN